MPKLPSQGRWGCRGSVGCIGNTQLGYEHVGTVAQRRKAPSLALGKAAGCFPPVSHYKVILRQADPVPQLWGGQGVLGALLLPTPTEAEQGSKGAVCAALHKQHPGVQHRGHPVPGGVTRVSCHLAFGNHHFSQVQRGSAEDLSLVSFNMEEGNTCPRAAWLFL